MIGSFSVNGGGKDYISQRTVEHKKKVHVGQCSANIGHEYFVFRAYINLIVLLTLEWDTAHWC